MYNIFYIFVPCNQSLYLYMKRLLGLSCMLIMLLMACKKDEKEVDSPTVPEIKKPMVYLPKARYGLEDFVWGEIPVRISDSEVGGKFSYELTGSNGMKPGIDTIIHGTGTTNALGNYELKISLYEMLHYRDGQL